MEKIFISPQKYIQGSNILLTSIDAIQQLGKKPLLLCDDIVWGIIGEQFATYLQTNGLSVIRITFNGEATATEIKRIVAQHKIQQFDCVLGLGGGKTLDVAKSISYQLKLPIGILPTVASTDAPTSAISVLYNEQGIFEKYVMYPKSPDLILVDTAIIAQAPAKLLAAGIADALATRVEADAVLQGQGKTLLGGKQTLAAQAIAEKCEETLFTYAIQAYQDCQNNESTPALDAVIEANILLSGIGFESGGLAAAHAIHNGFSIIDGKIHQLLHGEKIAYTTLVQLFLEQRPQTEINRFLHLYQALNLPITLAEMHLENLPYEQLVAIGKQANIATETMQQMPMTVTNEDVADAILAVDRYVRNR